MWSAEFNAVYSTRWKRKIKCASQIFPALYPDSSTVLFDKFLWFKLVIFFGIKKDLVSLCPGVWIQNETVFSGMPYQLSCMVIMSDFRHVIDSFWYNLRDHYSGSYTRRVLAEAVALLVDLWPYLVAGILITTFIKMFLNKEKIAIFFNSRQHVSILLAALIGVIAPLGSYVVIPLSASLFLLGTPLPVLMALLVSSPLIDPNLFILTAGAFGYKLALARLAASFLLGLTAGYLTQWLIGLDVIQGNRILRQEARRTAAIPLENPDVNAMTRFFKLLSGMTLYICKYFFLAILLAALIKILTPPNLMIKLFNGNNFLSVLFSTAAGVPFYTCGGAAIPVVRELADLGLSQGAVLAFFIAGPVTKFSNLVLMYAAYNFRIFMIYIMTGIFGALLFGWIYNIL